MEKRTRDRGDGFGSLVVLRTGLFARHYAEDRDRPWRRSIGAEIAAAILLR